MSIAFWKPQDSSAMLCCADPSCVPSTSSQEARCDARGVYNNTHTHTHTWDHHNFNECKGPCYFESGDIVF
eukprot:109012-Heterocapsa_arctica.AAC.1